jgi:ABC-type transport system involved in multi-copper enzyme maturation permease subunit
MVRGTLTLLTRALRQDARLRRAHAFRIGSVMLLFAMLIGAHVTSLGIGAPGLRFFQLICVLNGGLITLAGVSYFSSVITEEKEDGTLGLLKLADLSTLSILFGKSTTRLFAALFVFIGQFPFALLAITLGGVTVHQVWSAYVALAAYMVLVANVALLASVVSRRSGAASLLMILILLALLAGVPALHHSRALLEQARLIPAAGSGWDQVWPAVGGLYDTSIITRLQTILSTGFAGTALSAQVWWSLAGAAACFALAWRVFDRFTEYLGPAAPPRGLLPRVRTRRRWRIVPRPWRCSLIWKDFHFMAGGPLAVALKLVLYPLLVFVLLEYDDWSRVTIGVRFPDTAWFAVFVIAVVELLLYASRLFGHELRWGTLPCLALLPRSAPRIGYGKAAGCLLGSLPTWLLVVALAYFFPAPNADVGDFTDERAISVLVLIVLLLHLTVLYSLIVRWGALPLAIATLFVSGTCLFPVVASAMSAVMVAGQTGFAQSAPILYIGGLLTAVLQILIALRFRAAAAE